MKNSRLGMAVPLVLLFVIMTTILLFSMMFNRTATRKQSLASYTQKQAYYMAVGGIQHALLKLRLLHREAYDAGAVARGVCPFFTPRDNEIVTAVGTQKSSKALDFFRADLDSRADTLQMQLKGGEFPIPDAAGQEWYYEVTKLFVSTYHTSTTGADAGLVKEVAVIEAMGYAYDPRDKVFQRKEFVTKTVEMRRRIQ